MMNYPAIERSRLCTRGYVPENQQFMSHTCLSHVYLVKLRGEVAPGVGLHVVPEGVLLPPGEEDDEARHEAVQAVQVLVDHRGGARQA